MQVAFQKLVNDMECKKILLNAYKRVIGDAMAAGRPRNPLPTVDPAADDAAEVAARVALAERLDGLMRERGLNTEALANQSGVSKSALQELLGARRQVGLTLIARIASALDLPLAALFGAMTYPHPRQATTKTIPIRGGARLGAWRSMALRDEARGEATDTPPADERYRDLPRYGVEVEDDHLAGLGVPRGAVAIVADVSQVDIAIESGRTYLVHRVNEVGLVESSFRRATASRDGSRYHLAPVTGDAERNRTETIVATREEIVAGKRLAVAGLLVAYTVRLA